MTDLRTAADEGDDDNDRAEPQRKLSVRAKIKTPPAARYARRGATPSIFNGLHRRRNKRVTW